MFDLLLQLPKPPNVTTKNSKNKHSLIFEYGQKNHKINVSRGRTSALYCINRYFRVMLPTRGRNADYKLWYERVIIIDIQY